MKKKWIAAIAMILAAAFILSACGSKGGNPGSSAAGDTSDSGKPVALETYDVGKFTVGLPAGWNAFPQEDIFGDKDENGKYPISTESIVLGKGAEDEWSALSGPMVRIYYYDPDAYLMDSRGFYEDIQELEGVTVGGVACEAFQGTNLGYSYQFVTYITEDAQYEFNILVSTENESTGISWDDPEVLAIMESVTAKK